MKSYIVLFVNIVTRFFTAITLVFALLAAVTSCFPHHDAMELSAIHIIKIFIAASVFGIITVVRASLDNKKWMLRLSFIQKRWIFFPLYLIAMLFFIYYYGMLEPFGIREAAIYSTLFFIVAGIITAVAEKKYKDAKRNLTESVTEYKNKIGK